MSEKDCYHVFVSSTSKDLTEYRQKALEILARFQCLPLAMEYFGSRTRDAETVCEDEIKRCDIFIGIYAHRYGYVPGDQGKSITQMEYELAREEGKDCLCFMVDEDFAWKPKFIEREKQKELETFLGQISKNHVMDFFTTPDDFGVKLATSLANYVAGRKKGAAKEKRDKGEKPGHTIPRPPLPYIAHPYPQQANFTGRLAEMAVLSNWFHNERQPMLVMEAIGGMGKSALSWAWLQKEILAQKVEAAGVFWWSFYEEPFEAFIPHLTRYVTGGGEKDMDVTQLAAALAQGKFLLVLDGLERALIGYAGMEAMFIQEKRFQGDKEAEAQWDQRMRQPVHPLAERFLRALSVSRTRTLITTRLFPAPLERLEGVKHVPLAGLSPGDTVSFLAREGVKGSRAELEEAGRVYDHHPLMLTLLAAAVARSRSKDIAAAFSMNLIDRQKPHKILSTSFNLLSQEEREVVSHLSLFRSVFTFEASAAVVQGIDQNRLWEVMMELRSLGFLFYDESADHFDFHPIMRSFLYRDLVSSGGVEVHHRAVEYFQALPEPEKVVTLEDLAPVIELYHHLVKAGKFDEALDLFRDRINKPTYYQLSAYHLRIELLRQLFPEGDNGDPLPRLKTEAAQAWTLNTLANTYALSGQPAKAESLYLMKCKFNEKNEDKKNLVTGLINVASMSQIYIGQFSASSVHLRKSITLCREIEDEYKESVGHQELGRVLAFRGKDGGPGAEEELDIAFKLFKKNNNIQSLRIVSSYRSLSALFRARLAPAPAAKESQPGKQSREALEQALRALDYCKLKAKSRPNTRDFVQAYWLLGEALVQCEVSQGTFEPFEIPFYDDHFQEQTHSAAAAKGNELTAAERCLHEALRRCRKTNMVYHEPDILLALARLDRAKHLPPNLKYLEEAKTIAQRAGYRTQLADYHLLCGQLLLDPNAQNTLHGLTAKEHLQKAQEYALDVSEISHLYESKDPDFYKDIPEYQMLKRGMTKQERIENGYYVAYQIADALLKKI